jgi:hypothetical protein
MLRLALLLVIALDPCDLKHVEDALWCETCSAFLESDTTLDRKFCKKCSEGKKKSERTEAKTKRVCRKTWYECAEHPDQRAWSKSKKCKTCSKSMQEKTGRSDILYRCRGCTKVNPKAEACPLVDCKKQGLMFEPQCARSGSFPHVAEK